MQRAVRPVIAFAALALTVAGCENRETPRAPGVVSRSGDVRQSQLQPGGITPAPPMRHPFDDDPYAIGEGKRLFAWYNCSGCHFAGGGGIGPPLMDEEWIYGKEPQNILASIMEGRPNGMPSYRGKLPQDHALKIVAYVRTLERDAPPKPVRTDRVTEDTARRRTPSVDEAEPGRKGDDASAQ